MKMFLNPLFFIYILIFCLVFGIIQWSWTPHYPAKAEVFYQPKWMLIHSPITGIMTHQKISAGDKLGKGQIMLHIQPMVSLLSQAHVDDEFQYLQQQTMNIHQEKNYQHQMLKHYSRLSQQKLIALQDFHEKKQQYQKVLDKHQQLQQKLKDLEQKRLQIIQSPIEGRLVKCYVHEGEIIHKGKKLLLIQPKKFQYWVQFHLPVSLQHHVFIGQQVRLAWMGSEPLKIYPMRAIVREISPWVHDNQFIVQAEILNASDFASHLWAGLSLDAYFLGEGHPLWKWIYILLKGVQ